MYAIGAQIIRAFSRADSGELLQRSCLSSFVQGCDPLPLTSIQDAALSRDGTSLHVVTSAALHVLQRDSKDALGPLARTGCFGREPGCRSSLADGALDDARAVAIMPQGNGVYVAGGGSLVHFTRTQSGALSYTGCLGNGIPGCRTIATDALTDVTGLAISPDTISVYTVSRRGTLAHFRRNTRGQLRFAGCEGTSVRGCRDSPRPRVVAGSHALAFEAESRDLYVASGGAFAVSHYRRALVQASDLYPGARSLVILTLDDLIWGPHTAQRLSRVLTKHGIRATFFARGDFFAIVQAGGSFAPAGGKSLATPGWSTWRGLLSPYEFANHTVDHGYIARDVPAEQAHQLACVEPSVSRAFETPTLALRSFRAPGCDAHAALFDTHYSEGLIDLLFSSTRSSCTSNDRPPSGILADSSIPYLSSHSVRAGFAPTAPTFEPPRDGHGPLNSLGPIMRREPRPYVLRQDESGRTLVEFPFVYPSDGAAALLNRDYHSIPALWGNVFDEIHRAGGVMVVIAHPWYQAGNGNPYEDPEYRPGPDELDAFLTHVKSTPGAVTATLGEATFRYLQLLER
jgi:peptidoglycan/xylan/chitin deacetylase (PgdA/CDA1 family)